MGLFFRSNDVFGYIGRLQKRLLSDNYDLSGELNSVQKPDSEILQNDEKKINSILSLSYRLKGLKQNLDNQKENYHEALFSDKKPISERFFPSKDDQADYMRSKTNLGNLFLSSKEEDGKRKSMKRDMVHQLNQLEEKLGLALENNMEDINVVGASKDQYAVRSMIKKIESEIFEGVKESLSEASLGNFEKSLGMFEEARAKILPAISELVCHVKEVHALMMMADHIYSTTGKLPTEAPKEKIEIKDDPYDVNVLFENKNLNNTYEDDVASRPEIQKSSLREVLASRGVSIQKPKNEGLEDDGYTM